MGILHAYGCNENHCSFANFNTENPTYIRRFSIRDVVMDDSAVGTLEQREKRKKIRIVDFFDMFGNVR